MCLSWLPMEIHYTNNRLLIKRFCLSCSTFRDKRAILFKKRVFDNQNAAGSPVGSKRASTKKSPQHVECFLKRFCAIYVSFPRQGKTSCQPICACSIFVDTHKRRWSNKMKPCDPFLLPKHATPTWISYISVEIDKCCKTCGSLVISIRSIWAIIIFHANNTPLKTASGFYLALFMRDVVNLALFNGNSFVILGQQIFLWRKFIAAASSTEALYLLWKEFHICCDRWYNSMPPFKNATQVRPFLIHTDSYSLQLLFLADAEMQNLDLHVVQIPVQTFKVPSTIINTTPQWCLRLGSFSFATQLLAHNFGFFSPCWAFVELSMKLLRVFRPVCNDYHLAKGFSVIFFASESKHNKCATVELPLLLFSTPRLSRFAR